MRKFTFAVMVLSATISYSQPQLETTSSVVVFNATYGNKYSYSGVLPKVAWKDTTLPNSTGARLICIDNHAGLDTVWYALIIGDTAATRRSRVYPGVTANFPMYFTSNIRLLYKVPSDSTKPVLIEIK